MIGAVKDGDTKFDRGLDSLSDICSLPPGCYGWSVNMLNRGGVLQTRPGFDWLFSLPPGRLQGLYTFTPIIGTPALVAFVDGVGYVSPYPYRKFSQIKGATMSPLATQIYFAQATQSAQNNADGSIQLITPRNLLMVQDGINAPAYFDGRVLTAIMGVGVTPQGTHIAWAGARLWVAQKNLVFASDIANPLGFTEQTYNTLGGVNYFTLPDVCTGLAALPGTILTNANLLAFTKTTTTLFQSSILNRTLWPATPNFQAEIFPTVGCVAPRSIVAVSGLLWWFSNIGLTRLDSAQSSALTTQLYRIDRELARSSYFLNEDLSKVCMGAYENIVLTSVPYADVINRHTWVYDASANSLASQNQVSYLTTAWSTVWASVWTGVQPVQWVSVTIGKNSRLFCASIDDDGNNRVYEAFSKERRDNGCDIVWSFETRAYNGNTPLKKAMRFFQYKLSELQGEVNISVYWAGAERGRWKRISNPTFYSEEGNLLADTVYSSTDMVYALKKQSRIARTQDVWDLPEDVFSSAGVEGLVEFISANKETIDTAFQCRMEGSGPCAVKAIEVFMDAAPLVDSGQEAAHEKPGKHFVEFDGAASDELSAFNQAPTFFSATVKAQAVWNNFAGIATATINGAISDEESLKRATQLAFARANQFLEETATPYTGGRLAPHS